jgi:hypothetical protein
MRGFKEAQETFRKLRDNESALLYHRMAWAAYLYDNLPNACMLEAMAELDQFWGEAP